MTISVSRHFPWPPLGSCQVTFPWRSRHRGNSSQWRGPSVPPGQSCTNFHILKYLVLIKKNQGNLRSRFWIVYWMQHNVTIHEIHVWCGTPVRNHVVLTYETKLEFVDHSVHFHPCTDPPPALALVGVALLVVPAGDWTSSHVMTSVILSWNILLPWGQMIQWGIPTRWLDGRPAAFIRFEITWEANNKLFGPFVAKYLIGFRTWTGLRESLDTCKWQQSNSSLES